MHKRKNTKKFFKTHLVFKTILKVIEYYKKKTEKIININCSLNKDKAKASIIDMRKTKTAK